MEFCHPELLKPSFRKNIESDLLAGMKIMHSIQLVHQEKQVKTFLGVKLFKNGFCLILDSHLLSVNSQEKKPGHLFEELTAIHLNKCKVYII
jgi:hypothetical protein